MANEIKLELTDEEEEVFIFLDTLRESGVTNMFGAAPYIEEEFGISRKEATKMLVRWMETFSQRHPEA